MEVIYFSKGRPGQDRRLLEAVRQRVSGRPVTAVCDMDEFKGKLAGKRGKERIAIIVAADEQFLIDVYFARTLLTGISTVLVLPDHERLTAALAFRIRPDHTIPADAGMAAVTATVRSILRGEDAGSDPAGTHGGAPPAGFFPGGGLEVANS